MIESEKIHMWQHCHHCEMIPIIGQRYECQSCPTGPDIDLCSSCFKLYQLGKISHPSEQNYPLKTPHVFLPFDGVQVEPFYNWLDIPAVEYSAPIFKEKFLVRPEFHFGHGSAFGGYGFVVKTSKGKILLTALHVLDEVIKKCNIDASIENDQYTGLELPAVIDSVNLYDVMEDKWMLYDMGTCKTMMVMPDARLGDKEPLSYRDICAFLLEDDTNIQGLELASKCPGVGDPVWLIAKMQNNSISKKAVVVEKTDRSFVFRYDNDDSPPKFCSGAPLVDRYGNVVAINAGSGYFGGQRFGHANHVESIKKHLSIS